LGSTALAAGDEVEGGSNGEHHGVNPACMLDNPVLLLGASQAHKEPPHSRGGNAANDGGIFFGRERPKRRALNEHHIEIRVAQSHSADESIESSLATAIEADRHTSLFGCRQHEVCGVRAADPLSASLSESAKRPYQRHSVREDHVGVIQPGKKSRIVRRFHNHVNRGEKKRAGLPLRGPGKTAPNHLIVTADGDIHPKDGPGDDVILKLHCRSYG